MDRVVAQLRRCDRDLVDIGGTFGKHFLEVGSGDEILTRCVREKGLTVMDPVDKKTGWDLTRRSDMQRLRTMIREERPLITHIAPDCRIFRLRTMVLTTGPIHSIVRRCSLRWLVEIWRYT